MKNSKNKRTIVLAVILLGLLVVAYKTMFVSSNNDLLVSDENVLAGERVETILKEIEGINFDLSVMENESFKSLKSIETPLVSLPVGRPNPFSLVSGSN
ncbi:MAG: hypothetical protein WC657_01135 [Candidatus Paceibacterota bacterium]|jgi:hypothetical protein